ncbi:hypothetical protein [Ammoniphilus sp. YIM 78166]|uniref:hypothetical protein n=1 Tax=Ammoniphilus sp. YIM 78166 TaxID=1644106 RepID=UPI00107044B5|nr:hypothetical protein [Ammoniphilus sp. YIM 78166]
MPTKIRIGIIILLLLHNWGIVHAQVDISKLLVEAIPLSSPQELIKQSTHIVYCSVSNGTEEYPSHQFADGDLQVVNYVQALQVKRVFKGTASRSLRLLTSGTDPQPLPPNPLNIRFPGPLAEGDYVLFLKEIQNTNLYSVLGGWQGVYPYVQGKTISLGEQGFPQLRGLSLEQMERLIRETT